MVYAPDLRDRMKLLLTEVICQICTKEVPHKYQIHIEGTICVTSDTHPAFAIQIAQLLSKAADVSSLRGMSKSFQPAGGYGGPTTPTDSRSFGQPGPPSGGSNQLSPPVSESGGGDQLCSAQLLAKSAISGHLGTRSIHEQMEVPSVDGRDLHLRRALLNRHDSEMSEPVDMRGSSLGDGHVQRERTDSTSDGHSLEPLSATVKRKLSNIDDPEDIIKNVQRSARQILRKVSVTENQGFAGLPSPPVNEGSSVDYNKSSAPLGGTRSTVTTTSAHDVREVKEPHDPHRDGPLRKRNKFEYCREIRLLKQDSNAGSDSLKAVPSGSGVGNLQPVSSEHVQQRGTDVGGEQPVARDSPNVSKEEGVDSRRQDSSSGNGDENSKEEKQDSSDKDVGNDPKGRFTVKDRVRNMIFQREKSVERLRTNSTGSSSSVIRDILQGSNTPGTPSTAMLVPNFVTAGQLQRTPSLERIGLMRQASVDTDLKTPTVFATGAHHNSSKLELHVNTSLPVGTPTQSLSGPPSFKLKDQKIELLQSPTSLPSPVIKLGQHVAHTFSDYLSQPGTVSSPAILGMKPVFATSSGTPVAMDYMHTNVQRPSVLPLPLPITHAEAKDAEIIGEPKVCTTGGQILPGSPASALPSSGLPVNYSSIPMDSAAYKDSAAGYKMLAWQMKNMPLNQLGLKQEPGTPVTSGPPTTPGSTESKHSPGEVSDLVKSIMDTEKVKQFNLGHLSKETINGLIIVDHDTQKCISPQDYVYKDEAGETQVRACEYCGKHFKYFSKLMEHIRSHTKQKPYKCSICGRTYTYKGDLTVHIRQHSTSKPYVCDCGRSFASKKYLSVHQSQARIKGRHAISKDERHAQYECSQCGKRFKFFSSFDLHLQTHQTSGPTAGDQLEMFECQSCNRLFKDHSLFVEHVLEHENGEHPRIKCEVEDEDYEECLELDEEGNSSIEDKDTGETRGDESDTTPPKGHCQTYRVIQPVMESPDDGRLSPKLAELRPLVMGKTVAPKVMVESIADATMPPIVSKPVEEVVNLAERGCEPAHIPVSLPATTVVRSVSQPLMSAVHEQLRTVHGTPQMVLPGTHVIHRPSDLPGLPQQIQIPASSPFSLSSIPQTLTSLSQALTSVPRTLTSLPQSLTSIPHTLTSLPQNLASLPQTLVSLPQSLSSLSQPLTSPVSCQPLFATTLSQLTGLPGHTLQGLPGQTLQLHTVQPHGMQLLSLQPLQSPAHQFPVGVPISGPIKFTTTGSSTPTVSALPERSSDVGPVTVDTGSVRSEAAAAVARTEAAAILAKAFVLTTEGNNSTADASKQ
ncbi:uncharacterized protein LOC135498264 [Lineus longissimus]|uniref:uncharacterized protein LOC135498264 n=1 Tax=Lineus longissimus TaxID=88925 RepID=UPI00315D61F3